MDQYPFPPAMSLIWAVALVCFVYLTYRKLRRHSSLPLPPGPPRLPIFGNALDVPTKDMSETFRNMNAKYGTLSCPHSLSFSRLTMGQATLCTSTWSGSP